MGATSFYQIWARPLDGGELAPLGGSNWRLRRIASNLMSRAGNLTATYKRHRQDPMWKLLAADHAPTVLAILQANLFDKERALPASVLHERVERNLEELRRTGEPLVQTAQAQVSSWLNSGWLERSLPPGASEEVYELSAAATAAIRFVSTLEEPRRTATESRLNTVIQQLVSLAKDTDPNPESRLLTLRLEQQRLQNEIEAVSRGNVDCLPEDRAIERIREAIGLADELTADFRFVRDQFERLNRDLREKIVENEGSRAQVLDELFSGVDVIGDSEAGRTFAAFWRHLLDPEQSYAFELALEELLTRDFALRLERRERAFLAGLVGELLGQGGTVHETLQHFARSLKNFVQSREYLEHRRMHRLLKTSLKMALELKEQVNPIQLVPYDMILTSSRVHSVGKWLLHDPSMQRMESGMADAEGSAASLEAIGRMLAQSEIDFRTLKDNIRSVLTDRFQTSIGEVLETYPAHQGLGSIVGYLALGSRHGRRGKVEEMIHWRGEDQVERQGRIPAFYFTRECLNGLI